MILNRKKLTLIASFLIIFIIVLVPFHAFLSIYLSSLFGHYTLFRLWKEFLLVIILLIAIYFAFFDKQIRKIVFSQKLTYLILLFLTVQLIWGIVSYLHKEVSTKALFYGLLVNCRYFIFFLACYVISLKNKSLIKKIPKMILYPALMVVIFGLLQIFILPNNFLSHFGYGPKTILPFETINANSHYVRIISTLRGSNPLGAYLIVPISFLGLYLIKNKKRIQIGLFLLGSILVLIFSFSRSALLGAIVALGIIIFLSIKSAKIRKNLFIGGFIGILIIIALLISFRNNPKVQNVLLHTQTHSASKISSDQAHLSALRIALNQVIAFPMGKGPGTSGPASVYNKYHAARIPENYFLQIAEETGLIGIGLYLAITFYLMYCLWQNRENNLGLILFASLVGISIVNLFLFGWSDDTLSYLWWGIAGIAFTITTKKELSNAKK